MSIMLKRFVLLIMFVFSLSVLFGRDRLAPRNALRLSAVVLSLEEQGYLMITDVSFEGAVWEVEVYRDRQELELRVDPYTGEILSVWADHDHDRWDWD